MSTEFNQTFVALVCPQCGGKVEIEPAVFDSDFIALEGVYFYLGAMSGENIQCLHCGVSFVRKQIVSLQLAGAGNLQIDTGGGSAFAGDLIIAHVTGGERNVAIGKNITSQVIIATSR